MSRQGQIRAHQNKPLGAIFHQDKTDLFLHWLPYEIQAQKRDGPAATINLNGCLLKLRSPGIKKRHQTQLIAIFSGPATATCFGWWVRIAHDIFFGPGDNMDQSPTFNVDHILYDQKYRSHGKISVEHQQALSPN